MSVTAVPCDDCTTSVIHVRTERGRDFAVNAERVSQAEGGRFALRDVGTGRPQAFVPTPRLAFGRKLYAEHKGCSASARTRRAAS